MNTEVNEEMPTASANKVTVGFKCRPALKKQLSSIASELGFTVSEFVEALLADFTDLETYIANNNSIGEKNRVLSFELEAAQKKLAFYECPLLEGFFKRLKNKELHFTDYEGNSVDITFNSIQDVYQLMIRSFKISDNL
ncbi:MAG: hypothetical protein NTY88_12490 [Bacteroidetes bacterium]|nr:hypothetical protein [Bacteroidota bacterium]